MCLLAPLVRQARRPHRRRTRTTSPTRSTSTASSRTSSRSTASRSARPGTASYFLGADGNGRDVMVRLLYGGRNSLFIGVVATIITPVFATILGLVAGYFRGWRGRDHLAAASTSCGRSRCCCSGVALGDVARARRPEARADHDQGDSLLDPDAHHRGRLRRLPRATDPRRRCSRCARRSSSRPRAPRALGRWRIMFTELLPNLVVDDPRVLPADRRQRDRCSRRRCRSSAPACSRRSRRGAR